MSDNIIDLDQERRKRRAKLKLNTDQKIDKALKKFGHLSGCKERVCENCGKVNLKPYPAFICDHCGHLNEKK